MINSGVDGVKLRQSLQSWSESLERQLMTASTPVKNNKQVLQVGTLSANGEQEIGQFIVDAMETVGRDGIITVEDAKGFKSYLEKVKGTRIDRGYISPYFVNDQSKNAAVLDSPVVLLVSGRI